jgi:hypothetical protein
LHVWNHSNTVRTVSVFHTNDGNNDFKYDLHRKRFCIFPLMREKDTGEQKAFEAAEVESNVRSLAPLAADVGRQPKGC